MSPELIGALGIVVLLVLLVLRVPVAIAMMIVAVGGYAAVVSPEAALSRFAQDAFKDGATYTLSVVPMFVLMGMVLANAGVGSDLFVALDRFLWKVRGGLATATIGASALFGAVNGSSVASATTMSLVATPEMRKAGYNAGFAGGVTAAGSTLGAIIPPSALLVLYGLLTEVSIGQLLIASLLPGLMATIILMVTAYLLVRRKPDLAPRAGAKPQMSRWAALVKIWPVPVIFGISMGGLYGGFFTATEAGAVGAFLAIVYAIVSRRLTRRTAVASVSRTVRVSAMVFLLVIAGKMFGYFLAVARLPMGVGDWVSSLTVPPILILLIIFAVYFVLGALMDETAILVIMTPITLPIILALGYDPVWFGVASTMMLLSGLIMPPVGVLVFVVSGVTKIPLAEVYKGILPFAAALCVAVLLVFVFPEIALWPVSFMK